METSESLWLAPRCKSYFTEGMGHWGVMSAAAAPTCQSSSSLILRPTHVTRQRLFLSFSGTARQMNLHVGSNFLLFSLEGKTVGKGLQVRCFKKIKAQTTPFLLTNLLINHSHNFQSLGPFIPQPSSGSLCLTNKISVSSQFPQVRYSEHLL